MTTRKTNKQPRRTNRKVKPASSSAAPNGEYIRVKDVVAKTGKASATVYRWLTPGPDGEPKVRSIRVGSEVHIDRASLAKFLGPDAKRLGIVV